MLDMPEQHRGHLMIVLNDLSFDDVRRGKQYLVQIGQLDFMLADLRDL
jgi:hypothetical protein